jgi:hypothetical protein
MLVNLSIFGEVYLVKGDKKEDDAVSTTTQNSEYFILKLIDKAKFLKRERAPVMKQVKQMMYVEHPSISSISHFFMSPDYFYFLNRFAGKPVEKQKPNAMKSK